MSETPKDRAKDPRRVPNPTPISFPGPSTVKKNGPIHLDKDSRIADGFVAGSRNPIIDMMDTDDVTLLRRDSNRTDSLFRELPND